MSDDLLEMQKDTFKGLLAATWIVSLAVLWLMLFIKITPTSFYLQPLDIVACAAVTPLTFGARWLTRQHFRLATWLWVCAYVVLLVVVIPWNSAPQLGSLPYAFTLIAVVSSLLISRDATLYIAGLASMLSAAALDVTGHFNLSGLGMIFAPLALMWIIAGLSWLSSDQLVTALEWAWNAQVQMRIQAETLRESRDELKKTVEARDNLNAQLREAHGQVTRRAAQLEAAAEVSRRITSLLELERLLIEVTNLICDKFGYYYTGVMLVEEPDQVLVLRAAGGERGPAMLERGLRMAIDDTSTNGHTASTGQVQCVNDISMARHFRRDDLLRETVSELSIPLQLGPRVVGTLDVQSTQMNAFTPDDVAALQGLASQVAIAIQNARLYAQVRQFNQQLEQMVQQRTAELEQAYKQLEQLDRNKSDFINIAAHELRTPLTVMQGYTAIMRNDPTVAHNAYLTEVLNGVLTGTARLHEIVNSMLDVARIDSQVLDLHPEPMTIVSVIELVQHEFAPALEERQLTMLVEDVESLPAIKADPDMLYKVFYNVVINAIKYTPDGGKITVAGRHIRDERLGDCIEVQVRDTGVGIAPEHHERIFEKFYQTGKAALHSSGKTKFKGGGPGLGLAIARGIVQAHNGRIWVESSGYDEATCPGSIFHILVPVSGVTERPNILP